MPHLRKRHILPVLEQASKFWPVTGLLGLRQCGKSTVLRDLLQIQNYYTLDDEDTSDDIQLSAKNFLGKVGTPVVIDEAQKAPKLFDAVKFLVDKKRIPGSYYLTGSSQFSAKLGIRESLTGRIGLIHLHPFTLAEDFQKDFESERVQPFHQKAVRFSTSQVLEKLTLGGLPVPLFTRSKENREKYYSSWLDTAIFRDAARAYGAGYEPDTCWSILRQIGSSLKAGETPTLKAFKQDSRVLRKYLQALEDIFLLRKLPCHELGVGKEIWMMTDCGLATSIMGTHLGEGATLSLGRIFVLNEILARAEYSGHRIRLLYYKSARGKPIDLLWNDTLIKISVSPKTQLAYDERALAGALRKLNLTRALLCCPRDEVMIEKNGISIVPWSYWS
jgi:hypothetical protein